MLTMLALLARAWRSIHRSLSPMAEKRGPKTNGYRAAQVVGNGIPWNMQIDRRHTKYQNMSSATSSQHKTSPVEVLILGSILAILVVLVLPAPSDEVARDELIESSIALPRYRTQLSGFFQHHGTYTGAHGHCGMDPAMNHSLQHFELPCSTTASGYIAAIRGTAAPVDGFVLMIDQSNHRMIQSAPPGW